MKPVETNMPTLSGPAVIGLMQSVLAKGCRFRLSARGRSMTPFILDGDKLTVAPLAGRPLQVGDVVAYCRQDDHQPQLVIHRIVDSREDGFIVQGDGLFPASETVAPKDVLGRVVETKRNGRRVRFGFGPERFVIAWLSRQGLLWRMFSRLRRRHHP